MKRGSEVIVDQSGVQVLVEYEFERTPSFFINDYGFAPPLVFTELKSVNLIIQERWIDILPLLHENEKEFIIEQLTYEN